MINPNSPGRAETKNLETRDEPENTRPRAKNFIRAIVEEDLKSNRYQGRVVTRFPPEPNGYLHIGHAKSICLNFGLAHDYAGGVCHLRFDDTNPEKESAEYVESIKRDIRWLGFDWGDRLFHASDYFQRLYEFALQLIRDGKAYVCDLSEEEIRDYRGTVTEPGRQSPFRDRSVAENLDLFQRTRAGEFPDGSRVLRAKIDMTSPNMKMRDPLLYRIRRRHHYRSGDAWCIYPMYDFAHCLSDALEGITHSLCTLEFENNRELYDWILQQLLPQPLPNQYEFARLNLTHTVLSKRKLLQLVESNRVSGWDDPRMPTIAGMRRRGYTPAAIRDLCDRIGVAKANSTVDFAQLEYSVRNDLNHRSPRVMCVLRTLRLVIENFPEDRVEILAAPSFPPDVNAAGSRPVPLDRVLYIERDDFEENPPKGFFRLAPGREVRLRYAHVIRCERVIKDPETGEVIELRCSYDAQTLGVDPPDRGVRGIIHWVSAAHALPAEVRLYEPLFIDAEDGDECVEGGQGLRLNPQSLQSLPAYIEPSVADDPPGSRYQFERQGYFCGDSEDSKPGALVFNRTVALRDSWAKLSKSAAKPKSEKAPHGKKTASGVKLGPLKPHTPRPAAAMDPAAAARCHRYVNEWGLSGEDAEVLALDAGLAAFFERALARHHNPRAIANWLVNELPRESKEQGLERLPFGARELGALVALIDAKLISGKIAKDVLAEMLESGGSPAEIVERRGLRQVSDSGALEPIVAKILAENPAEVARYREGKKTLMGFFVGQVMKATRGKANPKLVNELLRLALG